MHSSGSSNCMIATKDNAQMRINTFTASILAIKTISMSDIIVLPLPVYQWYHLPVYSQYIHISTSEQSLHRVSPHDNVEH